MIETARELSREPHSYWTDQLHNQDSIAGYHSLGDEIWTQTGGEIDAFVHCVGTAASLRGVATVLKRYMPSIKIVAVEPAESSVLLGDSRASQDRRRGDRLYTSALGSNRRGRRRCRQDRRR
jgi:cysteine synthase A